MWREYLDAPEAVDDRVRLRLAENVQYRTSRWQTSCNCHDPLHDPQDREAFESLVSNPDHAFCSKQLLTAVPGRRSDGATSLWVFLIGNRVGHVDRLVILRMLSISILSKSALLSFGRSDEANSSVRAGMCRVLQQGRSGKSRCPTECCESADSSSSTLSKPV